MQTIHSMPRLLISSQPVNARNMCCLLSRSVSEKETYIKIGQHLKLYYFFHDQNKLYLYNLLQCV